MDPITTIAGPVNAAAFVDLSSTASGAATLAEVVQVITKTNEVIGGLTDVAADLVAAEEDIADLVVDLASEASARQSVDVALGAGLSTHTGEIAALTASVDALESYVANSSTEYTGETQTLAATWSRVLNFSSTSATPQTLTLPDDLSSFEVGQKWYVYCSGSAGVSIQSTLMENVLPPETSADTIASVVLGEMAVVSVLALDGFTGDKVWGVSVAPAPARHRTFVNTATPFTVPNSVSTLWQIRTGLTGGFDVFLPSLDGDAKYIMDGREITVILQGTPGSGTCYIKRSHANDTIVGASGGATVTCSENTAYTYRANTALKLWMPV